MTSSGLIQLYASDPAGAVNWRLLSGNNRESGRGVELAVDGDTCRSSVVRLQKQLSTAVARVRPSSDNRWRWELQIDGTPIAVSGRTFDRMIRCELAVAQFTASFRLADLRPGVLVLGARRWERSR